MIYAVHILNQKYVKVGYTLSEDVTKRIAQLQTGNPFEIRVLRLYPGHLKWEQEIHWHLKQAFLRSNLPVPANEWYPGLHPLFQGFLHAADQSLDAAVAYLQERIASHKERTRSVKGDRDGTWSVNKRYGSIRKRPTLDANSDKSIPQRTP